MTIIVHTRMQVLWIITLAVHQSFGAITPLVLSTNEPEKNGNLVITTTSNDTTVDWIRNGALPALTSCAFNIAYCSTTSYSNMVFAVNSTSSSVTITSLSYNANHGTYKAETETGASASVEITISSPVTSVSWLNQPPYCPKTVSSVTLTAVIPCVYPKNQIVVVFQMFKQNVSVYNQSVIPDDDGNIGCASHEENLKATVQFTSLDYANQQIQVKASVTHSLLKSKPAVISNLTETICFEGNKKSKALYSLLVLLIGVNAFTVLYIYIKTKKIEQLDYDQVLNIAQNCCGTWIFSELRFEFLVMLIIKFCETFIAVPILIVIGEYPVGPVIGIALAQIAVGTVVYLAIFWIVIWCLCRRKIAVNRVDQVLNIAQKCCGTWIFSELRFEFLVMLIIKFCEAFIAVPILIVIGEYPVGPVIGIAIPLIVGCTVIYLAIFWVVIWCFCRRKIAVNRVDSEIIKESPRKSINGDAGLRSPVTPGRKLPPLPPLTRTDLPPLIQTDPDKLVNTEKKKKKKKKTKTEVNEEDQAETNKSEINDQVDAENLPETNKTSY